MSYHNLQAIQNRRGLSYVTLMWLLIKCKLMTNLLSKSEKELYLLKSKHQTERLLLYYIVINMLNVYYKQLPYQFRWFLFDSVQNKLVPMATFWYQFSSFVQQNIWVCYSNNHFLCQTQITSCATFISGYLWFYTPF